jgi:hypothetical protein
MDFTPKTDAELSAMSLDELDRYQDTMLMCAESIIDPAISTTPYFDEADRVGILIGDRMEEGKAQ